MGADCIWRCWALLTCKIFAWLAIQYGLWTSDQRARHGIQNFMAACFTCLQGEDIVNHIMVQCVSARQTWTECFRRLHINIAGPSQTDSLEAWWINARTAFIGRAKEGFDYLVNLVSCHLWKQRNDHVFGHLNQTEIKERSGGLNFRWVDALKKRKSGWTWSTLWGVDSLYLGVGVEPSDLAHIVVHNDFELLIILMLHSIKLWYALTRSKKRKPS